jgi:hypothetical protein
LPVLFFQKPTSSSGAVAWFASSQRRKSASVRKKLGFAEVLEVIQDPS